MRQLPAAYYSAAHGPVFAYATRDQVHACCVTWRDDYVVLTHDELLRLPALGGRPDVSVAGVMQVVDLENAVIDTMSPHIVDGRPKPSLRRAFTIGDAVFSGKLFNSAIYAPMEGR
jgi:hypothetical protein